MRILNRVLTSSHLFFPLLLALILGVYGPLIVQDPVSGRDDLVLLNPLKEIQGPIDYVRAVKRGEILDIQPVRDFSFLLDLAIQQMTSISVHHGHNALLWFLICGLIGRILTRWRGEKALAHLLVFAYAIYPTFTQTVSWISARKHLLSYFFILLAIKTLMGMSSRTEKIGRRMLLISCFYTLSVFSQPISVLWPLWVLLYFFLEESLKDQRRELLRGTIPMLVIMMGTILLNMLYYQGIYVSQTLENKFLANSSAGYSLLSLGRSTFQLFFPQILAMTYDEGHPLNLIGLFALVLLIYGMKFIIRPRDVVLWASLFLLALAPVTLKRTNIFVSDTYLLLPSFAWLAMLYLALLRLWATEKRRMILALFICLGQIPLIFYSRSEAMLWMSDATLINNSYQRERSCFNIRLYAQQLLGEQRQEEGLQVAKEFIAKGCAGREMNSFFSLVVYYEEKLSWEEKVRLLQNLNRPSFMEKLTLALLYFQQGKEQEAWQLAMPVFRNSQISFGHRNSFPIKNFLDTCQGREREECVFLRQKFP